MTTSQHPTIRRSLSVLLVALVAAIMAGRSAEALTQGQTNAVENVAQAIAGTQVCPRYRPNFGRMTILALRFGFRFDDPQIGKALEERTLFHAARIKGRTADDICAALDRLFGPAGSNVSDLVVTK